MDLILQRRSETNVPRSGLALNSECHAMSTTRPTVFVPPLIELSETQKPVVHQHRRGVLGAFPVIDLVKVEFQHNRISVAWDTFISLERILPRSAVRLAVTSKELREKRSLVEDAIRPS